jgi:RNA polymerase sigma-70 factor (ECF subfamily)
LNAGDASRRREGDVQQAAGEMTAETRLVDDARQRDASAFELLVKLHVDRLYGAAKLIMRDADMAHDAVQDALVRAWQDLPRLRESDRFEPWLQRILVHACLDMLRRERRWTAKLRLLPPLERIEAATDAVADRELIGAAFRRLSVDHRVVLTLHFYLGLAPVEIAERVGIAPGTARSRLHYALDACRAAMDADARRANEGLA